MRAPVTYSTVLRRDKKFVCILKLVDFYFSIRVAVILKVPLFLDSFAVCIVMHKLIIQLGANGTFCCS